MTQKIPDWATAVIVAELEENRSDTQTDYFGSTTVKTIVLGFSKHQRNLFSEMRKFAARYDATAHLGPGKGIWKIWDIWTDDDGMDHSYAFYGDDHVTSFFTEADAIAYARKHEASDQQNRERMQAGEITCFCPKVRGTLTIEGNTGNIEHRENYAGGAGYYLGHDRYSGWNVRKLPLGGYFNGKVKRLIEQGHHIFDVEAKAAPETEQPAEVPPVSRVEVSLNDALNGVEIKFDAKPDANTRKALKLNGFRWHGRKKIWYATQTKLHINFAHSLNNTIA